MHVCMHVCMYMYMYMYMYICICMYVYIYIYNIYTFSFFTVGSPLKDPPEISAGPPGCYNILYSTKHTATYTIL